MWLVSDFTPADLDDPQPGIVIAGRIEAEHVDLRNVFPSQATGAAGHAGLAASLLRRAYAEGSCRA